ncbi:tubulin alpha-4A chain-like [Teleopsis dalmanni]|uniref:tubulin alpha-4A chain-like n=2 Tax=Teleopsis dalmanni TaxID=139649 RepID=UPI0018CF077E|nr:tubulin alpha-4A chain-like [Teleopsis dalmanni]
MQEIVSIYIGKAGILLGEAVWELYCMEHGILINGNMPSYESETDFKFTNFFQQVRPAKFVPRALFFDLEPTYTNKLRNGKHRFLFNSEQFLTGDDDAANNFITDRYNSGSEIIDSMIETVRNFTNNCENVEGFIIYHSAGGGTGYCLTALLMERLRNDYPKKMFTEFSIYPTPIISPITTEPFNAVLSTLTSSEYSDCCFIVDNEAMYQMCCSNLLMKNPNYTNLNRLIAQTVSSATISLRLESALNSNLKELQKNLVPLPRLNFPYATYAPVVPGDKIYDITVEQLTKSCFSKENQMVKCNPEYGKYLGCCLQFRGNVEPTEINLAIKAMREENSFELVDWCPSAFKVGVNLRKPSFLPNSDLAELERTACVLSNNTNIGDYLTRLNQKYNILESKNDFVCWFKMQNIEFAEYKEAYDFLNQLISDYEEVDLDIYQVD